MDKAINEAIKWLEPKRDSVDSLELRAKKKALEDVVQPIISKVYQQSAGSGEKSADKDEL